MAILAVAVVILAGNDFRFRLEHHLIRLPGGKLDAVLTLPTDSPARGLVVVIHGDSAIDATHDDLYFPWFEAAADAGYATLSWSKPGVGRSDGNWLVQSMVDRAAEASAVIDWALAQDAIPTQRIVLWGASQAGWVLPKVAAARDEITAIVALNPAINWLRQGRYNLLAELAHEHTDAATRREAIRCSEQVRQLLDQKAEYETYRASTCHTDPLSEERWGFVLKNHASDATDDLVAMRARQVPVFLMLSKYDRNVDVAETAAVYREILADDLDIAYFDAAHTMARPVMEESDLLGWITAVVWPRALMAENALAAYRDYLGALP